MQTDTARSTTANQITYSDVDFWPVECTVPRVELPGLPELVQGFGQSSFGGVPLKKKIQTKELTLSLSFLSLSSLSLFSLSLFLSPSLSLSVLSLCPLYLSEL